MKVLLHEIYDDIKMTGYMKVTIVHLKCVKDSYIVFTMFTEKSESDDTSVSSDAEKIDTMLGIIKNKLRASK